MKRLHLAKWKNPFREFFLKFDLIFVLSLPHSEGIFLNSNKPKKKGGD